MKTTVCGFAQAVVFLLRVLQALQSLRESEKRFCQRDKA